MGKMLHVVKEATGGFQIRESDSAGEGAGAGRVVECKNAQELTSGLRQRGASEERVAEAMKQLETSDNADIRL
jgi:hypothetical protein